MRKIQKVLVANRGEIAIRVFRACNELGIRTVAVYSKEDVLSLHRNRADEAYLVGEGDKPIDAYLDIEDIIRICKEHHVDAVHPGYGFLAENAELAKRCQEEGLIFIGPRVEHLIMFGDKVNARIQAEKAQIPMIPGTNGAVESFDEVRAFAEKYGFSKAYGSYEEMLADPQVDLVYIATPHSHHYLHAKMCLEAGKNVLCEKAFTVNADQARKLFALAKEKDLLITEAIWTRYMPSRKMIDDIISSGVIGEVTAVTANLNYAISEVERIRKPELAGGALLDVGVYTINFASMVLGDKLKDVQATAIFREGVDMLDTIAMVFEGDRMATLQCGAREISDRMGSIFGTKGYIQVQNINNPEKITVFDKEHKEVAAYLPPAQITGYEYEVEACARAIAQGEKECPEMPHDETVRVMEIMDGIRKSWGYEIPLYE